MLLLAASGTRLLPWHLDVPPTFVPGQLRLGKIEPSNSEDSVAVAGAAGRGEGAGPAVAQLRAFAKPAWPERGGRTLSARMGGSEWLGRLNARTRGCAGQRGAVRASPETPLHESGPRALQRAHTLHPLPKSDPATTPRPLQPRGWCARLSGRGECKGAGAGATGHADCVRTRAGPTCGSRLRRVGLRLRRVGLRLRPAPLGPVPPHDGLGSGSGHRAGTLPRVFPVFGHRL